MNDVIGTAEVEVRARLDRLEAGLRDARQKTESAARNMDAGLGRIGGTGSPIHQNLARMQTAFAQAEKRAVSFRASATRLVGGVGLVAGAIAAAVRPAVEFAVELDKLSASTGVSVERLQSLRFAADQSGAGADMVNDGLERLNRRLGEFVSTGAGPAQEALEQLGIEQEIATGKIEAGEPALDAILERLGDVPGNAEKAAIAAKLFGDEAGPRMVRLLSQGSDGVAALEQQFNDLGITVDSDTVMKLVGLRGELVSVRDDLNNLGTLIRGSAISFIADITVGFIDFAKSIGLVNQQFALMGDAKLQGIRDEIAETKAEIEKLETATAFPARGPSMEMAIGVDTKISLKREKVAGLEEELKRETAALAASAEIGITPTTYAPGSGSSGGSGITDTEKERERLLDDLASSERSIERNKDIYQKFIGLLKEPLPELSEIELKISTDRAAQEIEDAFLSAPEGLQDLAVDAVKSKQLEEAIADKVQALSKALDEQDRDAARAMEARRLKSTKDGKAITDAFVKESQSRQSAFERELDDFAKADETAQKDRLKRHRRTIEEITRAEDALLPRFERMEKKARDDRDAQLAVFGSDPSMADGRLRAEELYQAKIADIDQQRQKEKKALQERRDREAARVADKRAQDEVRVADEASRRQERARQDTSRALDALLPKYERLQKGAEDWRDAQLAAFDPSMVEDRARVEEAYQGKLTDIARQRAEDEEKIRDRQRQVEERQIAESTRAAERAAREQERADQEALKRSETAKRTAAQDRLKQAELEADIARAGVTQQASDDAGGAGSLEDLERVNETLADKLALIDREVAAQQAIARLVQDNVDATSEEIATARQLAEAAHDREQGERDANEAIKERQTLLEDEKQLDEKRRETQQRYQDEVNAANDRIIEGFAQKIIQAESFEDGLRQIGMQLLEIAANSFFQGAAGQTQPGAAGGVVGQIFGGLGASIFGSINPFGAFAMGGAFDSGGLVTAFANGGIVDNPTMFGYGGGRTGVMGEAGPEAIMPLRRGPDGKLGVAGGGGGDSHVTVNIQTRDVDSFQRSRTQVAATLARAVDRGRRNL